MPPAVALEAELLGVALVVKPEGWQLHLLKLLAHLQPRLAAELLEAESQPVEAVTQQQAAEQKAMHR